MRIDTECLGQVDLEEFELVCPLCKRDVAVSDEDIFLYPLAWEAVHGEG